MINYIYLIKRQYQHNGKPLYICIDVEMYQIGIRRALNDSKG